MGKLRLYAGISLIRLSNLFYKLSRLLCALILKPDDLLNLNRCCYNLKSYLKGCEAESYLNAGLDSQEEYFFNHYAKPNISVLILGCGGGRECLALSKAGFKVTGVDFISGCISIARRNAAKLSLPISFIHQDASRLDLGPEAKFDSVVFSGLLYSLIPSREKRARMLTSIKKYLAAEGRIFLNFLSVKNPPAQSLGLKNLIAGIFFGNTRYQTGDYVTGDGEFRHYFDGNQLKEEALSCGYVLLELNLEDPESSFAVLSLQ